jgi:hypothetical protein
MYLFDGSIERAAVDFAIGPNIRLRLCSPSLNNVVELRRLCRPLPLQQSQFTAITPQNHL